MNSSKSDQPESSAPLSPLDAPLPAPPPPERPTTWVKRFAEENHKLLWWGHSFYALGLGALVVMFAANGFQQARILAATLGGAFLLLLVLFRLFGHGEQQKAKVGGKKALKWGFLGMTYVLKNLYQGMLFFVLPFYWQSSSFDSVNAWFVCLLGVLAILSTLDLFFDEILMRYRALAAVFYAVTLFACANLVIPAFFERVPALVALLASTALSIFGFGFLHFPTKAFKERRVWVLLGVASLLGLVVMYVGRVAMPPVPLYVTHAGVGFDEATDGRLALEVTRLQHHRLRTLTAVSEVGMPGGQGDSLRHVWKRVGEQTSTERMAEVKHVSEDKVVRLTSSLQFDEASASQAVGTWVVDIVTSDDQIVGRTRFEVLP